MGKGQPAPPTPTQDSTLSVPPPPPPSLDIKLGERAAAAGLPDAKRGEPVNHDPDIQKILDQITERQKNTSEAIKNLTPEKMAFQMMRQVPRKDWNTPLTKMGHWPRGSTIAEIRANPKLMNFTPAQAMLKLFEMSDEQAKKGASGTGD